jgi:hypothetical protein
VVVESGSSKFKKNRPGPERGSVVSKNLKIMLDFFLVLLIRFAHNWNNGMLKYWNIGLRGIKKTI